MAVDMIRFTEPFRDKINSLKSDEAYISKVAAMGREKARESASKTVNEVREIIGFRRF